MPTYVYRCTKGHTFELFHGISDESRKRCPRCRSAAKRMPTGGSGVLFRGAGFYATDYRSKSYQESAKQDKAGSSGSAAEGAGGASRESGDTKPKPAATEGGSKKSGSDKPAGRRSGGRRDS